jgi:putative heme-binding domain-containing protein
MRFPRFFFQSSIVNRQSSILTLALLLTGVAALPQNEKKNPLEGNPKAIEQGMNLYRFRCAVCHGIDGRGEQATDLTETLHEKSDAQIHRIIERGIPGTEMPAAPLFDDEIWLVVTYLRTLGGAGAATVPGGDAEQGKKIFVGKGGCSLCHSIDNEGGRLGPDLSRIGSARSQTALTREIRNPSEYITPGYEPVAVVTRNGKRIRGCRKSEDAFSVQMMDTGEELRSFLKKDLRDVIEESLSLMPNYGPDRLTDAELRDLVCYLGSLRKPAAPAER